MNWNHSIAIGLAKVSCSTCHGYGLRVVHLRKEVPCHCVLRAIFRACYRRFRDCANQAAYISTVSLEFTGGKDGRRSYSRKREEYLADFCLVSRRVLNDEEYRLFRFHFLLGADWKLCGRRLGLDRGNFFHTVYRIQQKLGRAFAELKPYGLYPLDEYFGGLVHRGTIQALPVEPQKPSKKPPAYRLPLSA